MEDKPQVGSVTESLLNEINGQIMEITELLTPILAKSPTESKKEVVEQTPLHNKLVKVLDKLTELHERIKL